MPDTLLQVIQQRFQVAVDPDSSGGQILNSITPLPPFDALMLEGEAQVAPLTFTLTADGISVRAAQASDALVFSLPAATRHFTLVPPDGALPLRAELELLSFNLPLPFLSPAQVGPDGMLQPAAGQAELTFPDLLLIVEASTSPLARAHLAPSHAAGGGMEVAMSPAAAFFDASGVVGLGFDRAVLELDTPEGPRVMVPDLEIYIAPPGIPALAMHGGGHDLRLGLGIGQGLSGDFRLALAEGANADARPRFLHSMAARMRLHRNAVTLLELTGQVDIAGEVTARVGALNDPPGQIDYILALALDDGWQTSLSLRASGGREFLWRTQRPSSNPDAHDLPRDTIGAYAVFAPLLAPNLPGAGSSGYVDLALGAGAAAGLAASQSVGTQSVTLYGGQLIVRQAAAGPPEAFLFFDVETELHIKMQLGATRLLETRRPIKVRHKAIGLRLEFGSGGTPELHPVFDPAQGFSLDLSDPGMFAMPAPLSDILQPEGARIARENPLNLEIDLVLKADLGVVSVDRASVRIPLDSPAPPSLTALGAHVDVAGALAGSGYIKFLPNGGLAGSLDASLAPPIGVRVAAGLAIGDPRTPPLVTNVTPVLVTLELELPVPLPLANSGLGLFGFLGLFAMHFERDQAPSSTALRWFLERAQGDATRLQAWRAAASRWGFGLGTVLGTVEGGFLFHAKGMVVIELPGPRLLLVMNANIISPRPGTKGTDTGRFLAVIEINPGVAITIGIVVDYSIRPLLEFRVPIETFFNLQRAEDWHLDVGGIPPDPTVTIRFLSELRADGYLLIHGDGIPNFPLQPLHGFSVAAGVRASFSWGPRAIGLYLQIAAQADVGISFKPFLIIGKMTIRGELHLFIVSVEASASAEVIITEDDFFISAEVCGSVDFFFFEVEGCVKLELGQRPQQLPNPEPLARALSLHSRSPALIPGSAGDRPVDGSLGDSAHFDGAQFVGEIPVVPIDAIPVLQMEMRPHVDPACQFLGTGIQSKLAANGWLRRGEVFYRYTLKSVGLRAENSGGAPLSPVVGQGDTPVVWWDRYGKPSGGDDNDVQLALLSWIPDPTPVAAERTIHLDERVKRRWGQVCDEAAPPARVLWTFLGTLLGPSPKGWTLQGSAWPDQLGTIRSMPPNLILRVNEPWRSGNSLTDGLVQVTPAIVFGASTVPERLLVAPRRGLELLPAIPGDRDFEELFRALQPEGASRMADALRLDCAGFRAIRGLLIVQLEAWDAGLLMLRALDAQGEPTGFEQMIDASNSVLINNLANLPEEWIGTDSPWKAEVATLFNVASQLIGRNLENVRFVFFESEPPEGSFQIELGLADTFQVGFPNQWFTNWGLVLVEGITESEFRRFSFDETNRRNQIEVINGALGADQANRALLIPNATYTLDLAYDVLVTGADEQGNPRDNGARPFPNKQQQFRFKTDDKPPERLDPWVLATDPGPAQNFFFYEDPLRVVFSTNAVRQLYKAYERTLFARVKAASGKHPPSQPGFDPARVKLDESVSAAVLVAAAAVTPFESALSELVSELECTDFSGQHSQHERVTLTMNLEPLTDYILDLETDPAGDSVHPMFRRHFSTSRYASAAALAADIAQTTVHQRRVADAGFLAALAARNPGSPALQVSDPEFEEALRALQWGDLGRQQAARVTVIRQDGTPPLSVSPPVAVLLETPEPVWRWRSVPEQVTDKHGTRRYQLKSQAWLDVIETPVDGTRVRRFIHSSSGARTLVILQPLPSGTGATLSLALRRTHHPLFEGGSAPALASLCTISLAERAPWEEGL